MKQLTIPDTVLLVTASYDQAAGLVEKALTDSGEKWFRLDTDKFPGDVKSSYSPRSGFAYWKGTNRVESSEIKAVWYRRNVSPELPPTTDEHHREFCGSILVIAALGMQVEVDRWRPGTKDGCSTR